MHALHGELITICLIRLSSNVQGGEEGWRFPIFLLFLWCAIWLIKKPAHFYLMLGIHQYQ